MPCTCGHDEFDHDEETGVCEAEGDDGEPCQCTAYEHESDEYDVGDTY